MEPTATSKTELHQIDHLYFKIHYLINAKATELLRGQFTSLWFEVTGDEWVNEEASGTKFIEGIGKGYFASIQKQRLQRESIASGNVATWDLALLSGAIKTMYNALNRPLLEKDITPFELDDLKKIRNKLAHLGSTRIRPNDFDKFWKTAVAIMERLGLPQGDIEAASKLQVVHEDDVPRLSEKKASEFMEEGDLAMNEQKDYQKAIDLYTSAIECEGVSSSTLGVLYYKRSSAFMAVGKSKLDNAKEDAKRAAILKPYWPRGYSALATVYEREDKFWKALMQYQICLSIEPDLKFALEGVELCKRKLDPFGTDGGTDATFVGSVQDPTTFIRGQAEAFAIAMLTNLFRGQGGFVSKFTLTPKLETIPLDLIGLKPIVFQKMDKCKEDKVHKGFALKVKAVTDVTYMTGVVVVVMDGSGHFGRVVIYDYPNLSTVEDDLGFGSSFTIVNPYYKRASDGKMAIRVDDPNCVVRTPHLNDLSMCRYCFKSGADFKCRHCSRAKYCSRKCCEADLKERSHELVCVEVV